MADNIPNNSPPPIVAAPPGLAPTATDQPLTGARSIEVAAMLGSSVVDVKHIDNPRGGKTSALTYALIGLGAAALLISVLSFARGVSTASLNQQAARIHTEELGLPAHEFRPQRISLAYDWMAFGGLATSLACFVLALVRIRRERVSPFYRIGSDPAVDFATRSHGGAANFPLVAPRGDDFVVNFTAAMSGELVVDGESTALAELRERGLAQPSTAVAGAVEMAIPERGRIRLRSERNSFLIGSVARPRRHATPFFAGLSSTMTAFLAASAVFHIGLWAMLRTIPPDTHTLALTLGTSETRITSVNSRPEEPAIDDDEKLADEADDAPGGTGTQMALDSGKMGTDKSDRIAGRYTIENKGVDPQLARQRAVDRARHTGIAGAISGDTFASLTGTADFTSGLDDASVYGGMMGEEVGEMNGGFGFGVYGFGPGAGGTGWGTIGAGRYGTIGHGKGTGTGYHSGSGQGAFGRAHHVQKPEVVIGDVVTGEGLDKNIIRRYIRRKLPRIKYCYEKQLLVRPGLRGIVNTSFQISPNGGVLSAQAKGVSEEVSSCVADVVRSIQFPKPRGLIVISSYPFNFRPSGG